MASIQGIYIALFGRPADPLGLAYFNEETNNGADLSAIGDLSATDEYQTRFMNMNNVQIVTAIYQELFGRDPDAAGLAFFVAQLNSGAQNINTIAINILDGAQGADLEIVNNKIAAANLFTAAIDTPIEVGSYVGDEAADAGRAYLDTVTADDTTVPTQAEAEAEVALIVANSNAGNTVSGDLGAVVVGETGSDATDRNDTLTDTAFTGVETINAGFGDDRLNITIAGDVATAANTLVGVERLYVDSNATVDADLDLSLTSGLTQVWAETSNDLTISGLDTSVIAGIEGNSLNVDFVYDDVAGDSDAVTLAVNGSVNGAGNDVVIAGVETINVATVAGGNTIDLNAVDATQVNVTALAGSTGTFNLNLDGIADDATIDASAYNGAFTLGTFGEADITVIGSAQNDVVNVSADSEGITLTGGAGSDQFNISTLSNIDSVVAADIEADLISITDFNGSADVLNLALTGAEVELNNVEEANVNAAATLAAAFAVVDAAVGASNYTVFTYEGSTYIYQNDADATFDGGEGVVELVGFTGDLNDSNFI